MLRKDDALYSALKEVLAEREIQKIEKLMAAREDRALKKILQNLIKVIPNSVKRRHSIPESVISRLTAVERDGEYVRIVLDGDLDLRTFPSRQQYRNYYYCFRDRLPAMITPESYQALYDITFRLDNGRVIIDELIRLGLYVPSDSASIIECGAYNGWKALGFSHHLGEKGKILVLEMDDAQYELAKTNLQNNLPQQRFEILHTGVWHTEEERTYSYEHYASHSLKTPDEHSHHSQEKVVKTNTLDNIIERSDIDVFDFLNIQTGGSEYESVQGLNRNLNRVKLMWVGANYVQDGKSIRWKCINHLLEKECRVYTTGSREIRSIAEINETDTGGFWAVTPRYRNEIVPKKLS